jgi:putative spermidine/putrescine transport system ATP-binding protein
MASLELERLVKRFDGVTAVDDVSLAIDDGEFVSLLGPSGCGKSTTLGMIAGLLAPDAGAIRIGGEDVTARPAYRRNIGMVFQQYALFPHMTVAQNVAFGLRMRKVPRAVLTDRVRRALDLVRLPHAGERYPRQLSGGEQQRIAVARALVIEPAILLLDEPLSNLDARLREEMRIELREIQRRVGITTVFVTHDQAEALAMSDRIAVMSRGRLMQVGPPVAIYDRPANEFVSSFIGQTNRIEGRVVGRDGPHALLSIAGGGCVRGIPGGPAVDGPAVALVRPEKIAFGARGEPGRNALAGTVGDRVFLGTVVYYLVDTAAGRFTVLVQNSGVPACDRGVDVVLAWAPDHTVVIPRDPGAEGGAA